MPHCFFPKCSTSIMYNSKEARRNKSCHKTDLKLTTSSVCHFGSRGNVNESMAEELLTTLQLYREILARNWVIDCESLLFLVGFMTVGPEI